MKNFFRPSIKRLISTIALFLLWPMFGTVTPMCLSVPCSSAYFGFLGVPGLYIFGGLIDIFEALNRDSVILNTYVRLYLGRLPYLLPYLLASYLVICTISFVIKKINERKFNRSL